MAALTRTTLSAAYTLGDNVLNLTSATGVSAGSVIRVDQEYFTVQKSYVSGTAIPVRGGQLGSKATSHPITSGAVIATVPSDLADAGVASKVNNPVAGKSRLIESLTAAASVTLTPGCDKTVILNGTTIIALTIPVPTADMDGDELNIISNGAAAHTLTFTGGLSGAGTSYDVITVNATAPAAFKFVACNKLWFAYCQPPMGGTVTNIIGSVA